MCRWGCVGVCLECVLEYVSVGGCVLEGVCAVGCCVRYDEMQVCVEY